MTNSNCYSSVENRQLLMAEVTNYLDALVQLHAIYPLKLMLRMKANRLSAKKL